ncbi:MAG: hypothetical protein ACOYZ6_13235 [Chloroflexota bacterium]
MSPIFSCATLTLSKPSLRGILYFLLTVPLVLLAAEIVARSPIGSLLPAPSVEADSFLFDAKIYALENQVRRDGRLDCLFVGSSVANVSIDPTTVEQMYFQQTGETIHCYNLGYPAMTVENAAAFVNAAIANYSPRVVFYAFIPRDLTDATYTVDFLEKSPWFQAGQTQPSTTTWLVDHSYAYRYYQTWRYLLVNKNRVKRLEEIKNLTGKGFQPTEDIREPYPERITMMPEYVSQVWATPRPQQMLANLIALQSQDVRIVLVEAPIYRDPQYPSVWDAYERDYIPPLEQFAREKNVTFWRTDEISMQTPKPHWYDWVHVNHAGAATFSQWLGEMMAENKSLFE